MEEKGSVLLYVRSHLGCNYWIGRRVVVAVINGVFGLIKKPEKDSKKKSEDKISVNQTVSGNNNTVIGVQTDKREK